MRAQQSWLNATTLGTSTARTAKLVLGNRPRSKRSLDGPYGIQTIDVPVQLSAARQVSGVHAIIVREADDVVVIQKAQVSQPVQSSVASLGYTHVTNTNDVVSLSQ